MYQNLLQIMSAVRLMARPGGVGIGELAEHLSISPRSVYRLLDKLDELHYPYYDANEGGKERRYHINDDQAHLRWWLPIPDSSLTLEEKSLLVYLLNSIQDQPGMESLVHSLQQKIALWGTGSGSVISIEGSAAQSIIQAFPHIKKKAHENFENTMSTLIQAISEHRELECTYTRPNRNESKTFLIHPLTLFEHGGGMYLLALVPKYGNDIRMAVERIVNLQPTGQDFTPVELPSSLQDPFGIMVREPVNVRLWFSAEQAFYVRERHWPEGYSLSDQPNGQLELTFTTVGSDEVKRWILSLGPGAQILEPRELREELARDIQTMAGLYQ